MSELFKNWIGKKVSKSALVKKAKAPKPFKSGLIVNTVKGISVNPHTNKPAFTFNEDDSLVDCHICKLIEE